MITTYFKYWQISSGRPSVPISPYEAEQRHYQRLPYVVYLENQGANYAVDLKFRDVFCDVHYLDVDRKPIRTDSFRWIDQQLFLYQTKLRNYGMVHTYTFSLNGEYQEVKYFYGMSLQPGRGTYDVDRHFFAVIPFGQYQSLILQRNE